MSTATASPSRVARFRLAGRPRFGQLDLVILVVATASTGLLHRGMPAGVMLTGMVSGSILAMHALGLVLVMRSDRIINFAQVQLGILSATLFSQLVIHSTWIHLLRGACAPCVPGLRHANAYYAAHPAELLADLRAGHSTLAALLIANFVISLLLALVVAPILAAAVYAALIRRFAKASRLVLTVATLGIGQLVAWLSARVTSGLAAKDIGRSVFKLPFHDPTFTIGLQDFRTGDVVALVTVVLILVGLAVFLRGRLGVALRGAAEDPDRAATLGVNVGSIGSISWIFAGVLSALAGIIETMRNAGTGQGAGGSFDTATLVTILVVLIFARQTRIWLVLPVAMVVGVLRENLLWNQGSSALFLVLLLPLVLTAFLLQVRRGSRSDRGFSADLVAKEARAIPAALLAVREVRRNTRLLLAAVVLCVGLFPYVMSPGQVVLGTGYVLDAIVALSILILTGWAGQISLGSMGFAALGAWTAAVLQGSYHLPFLLCLLLGGLSGAVVAVAVGLPALRLRGLNLAAVTLCFSVSVISVLFTSDYLGGALPTNVTRPFLLGLDLNDERVFFYFSLLVVGLVTASLIGMRRSQFGRALIAARDNEGAAQALGVSLVRLRLEAFAVSGFIAALAGALIAFHQNAAIAFSFGPEQSIQIFLMTVIGGLGSILGPLLGAVYLATFALLGDPSLSVLATGGGLVAMLLLAPGGLASIVYRSRDVLFRRVALRRRIVVPGLVEEAELTAGVVRAPIVPKMINGSEQYVPERYRRPDNWQRLRQAK